MSQVSVLFGYDEDAARAEGSAEPEFFRDLNLDQVVGAATAGRDEYELKPFFHLALRDVDAVRYRQEVFRDLEREPVIAAVRAFSEEMRRMRGHLAQADKLRHRYQQESWFLDASAVYACAVARLEDELSQSELSSRGLRAVGQFLTDYVVSDAFRSLRDEIAQRTKELGDVRYTLLIAGNRVTVAPYEAQPDYAAEIEATFEKFKRGAVGDYRIRFREPVEMNQVEEGIIDRVALIYPDVFAGLDEFRAHFASYLDPTIARFDREIQFYLAYIEFTARLRAGGLKFCYPDVSDTSKRVSASGTFDIALANKLVEEKRPIVTNDLSLNGNERIVVVTGPNQGGKTTFARTFGQLPYLASIGVPVAGTQAALFLYDQLFTHFEKEEDLADLRGKLQDDLVRVHAILERATPNSIVILNEIFTSTTFHDALFLSMNVLERLAALDLLCVWVTFVDELASATPTTVSVVSTVSPEDHTVRTFKLVRRPADGLAYAAAIAAKYGVTYTDLKARMRR